jgi:hypothetical protein
LRIRYEEAPATPVHDACRCRAGWRSTLSWFLAAAAVCLWWRHALGDAVALPPAVTLVSAAVAAAVSVPSTPRRVAAWASLAGLVCGVTFPVAPPPRAIYTHAPPVLRADALVRLLDALDADPQTLVDRRVEVSGQWQPAGAKAPAAVYERIMACCAADAIDVGLEVFPAQAVVVRRGARVGVSGVVSAHGRRRGALRPARRLGENGDVRSRLRGHHVAVALARPRERVARGV